MKILILEGDGIGPEISAATVRVMTRANEAFGLGMEFSYMPIGFAAMAKSKTTFPQETLEAAKRADGTVLGPVSHNDYPPVAARRHQSVGRAPHRPRPLRQYPPGPHARGLCAAVRQAARSRDRARKHRGLLCRPLDVSRPRRNDADAGCRAVVPQDHPARLDAHRRSRFCARPPRRPQESHRRAQSQCAARLRRAVSRMRAASRRKISRHRLRGKNRRRHGGAAHSRRRPVRGYRDDEYVRRHPLR